MRFEYVVQANDQDIGGILLMNNAITWNRGFIIRQEHGDIGPRHARSTPAPARPDSRPVAADSAAKSGCLVKCLRALRRGVED